MKTPNTNEGVTEWLTRKALKHAGDAAFQNIDRSASYQSDFQNLKAAKGALKLSDPQIGASIQSAYFGGHITEDLDTFVGAFMSAGLIATQSNAVFAATAFGGRGGRRKYYG
jgi:hypothetical protein